MNWEIINEQLIIGYQNFSGGLVSFDMNMLGNLQGNTRAEGEGDSSSSMPDMSFMMCFLL
jgi:hypothetical protein